MMSLRKSMRKEKNNCRVDNHFPCHIASVGFIWFFMFFRRQNVIKLLSALITEAGIALDINNKSMPENSHDYKRYDQSRQVLLNNLLH